MENEKKPRQQTQTTRRRRRRHPRPHSRHHQTLRRLPSRHPRHPRRDSHQHRPRARPAKILLRQQGLDNQDFGFLKITVERPLRLNFAVTPERIARVRDTAAFADIAISRKRKNKKVVEAEELAGAEAQKAILEVLHGMAPVFSGALPVKNRDTFAEQLDAAFDAAGIKLPGKLRAALLSPGALGERDPDADACTDKNGAPEPDPELRDTENVPYPDNIALPLPLDYESKKNKGKVDVAPLLALVREHCEAYLAREVLPWRPDAWIDHDKIKVGYEIPFNRHFYEYAPPRPLDAIEADIKTLETEILALLKEVTA